MRISSADSSLILPSKRQLLIAKQLGYLLNQLAFLNLVGNLGNDDLVEAMAQILFLPARPDAETSPCPVS